LTKLLGLAVIRGGCLKIAFELGEVGAHCQDAVLVGWIQSLPGDALFLELEGGGAYIDAYRRYVFARIRIEVGDSAPDVDLILLLGLKTSN